MAVIVYTPNAVSVAMRFTQDGQEVENVYHNDMTVAGGPLPLDLLATAYVAWWNSAIRPLVGSNVVLNSVVVQRLDNATANGIEWTTGLPITGGLGGLDEPMNVTLAIKWLTGKRGRSFRGRTYHIGIQQTQVVNSRITPTFAAAIKGAYTALIAAVNADAAPLVVLSTRANKAPRAAGVMTPILTCSVDTATDSQRRRLPGRGR